MSDTKFIVSFLFLALLGLTLPQMCLTLAIPKVSLEYSCNIYDIFCKNGGKIDNNEVKEILDEKEDAEMLGEERGRRMTAVNEEDDVVLTVGEMIMANYQQLPSDVASKLVEMDIVKTPEVERIISEGEGFEEPTAPKKQQKRAVGTFDKWPGNRVPYLFHIDLEESAKEVAKEAMNDWALHTCIKFEEKKDDDENYIYFVEKNGCSSYVGMKTDEPKFQELSLGLQHEWFCRVKGVIIHEIGHAIGFWHEQTRPDRDDYVRIVWANIVPGTENEFKKYSRYLVDSLEVPYDYGSIMHYPRKAFSENGESTIVSLDGDVIELGQMYMLSPSDILQANLLYNCPYIQYRTSAPPVHLTPANSPPSPKHSFLIKNEETSLCLSASQPRNEYSFDLYSHEALYLVSLAQCDPSSKMQLWQWIKNDTLLHVKTFLCLGLYNDIGKQKLVLGTCKEKDKRMKWNCFGSSFNNLKSGTCVTVDEVIARLQRNSLRDNVEGSDDKHTNVKLSQRLAPMTDNEYHKVLLEDLYQIASINNRYHLTFQTCVETNRYQKWSIITTQGDDLLNDGDSVCSADAINSNYLLPCYAMDMGPLADLYSYISEWANCTQRGEYINGFYHTQNIYGVYKKENGLISGISCCPGNSVGKEEVCHDIDWWFFTDNLVTRGWFICPKGTFLKGFFLSTRDYIPDESKIKKVRCCKPMSAPDEYLHCYEDQTSIIGETRLHTCNNGYYVRGIFRENCNSEGLECEEILTCCRQVN